MKINAEICVGCGWCVKDCPTGAVSMNGRKAEINETECVGCRVCSKVCLKGAVLEVSENLVSYEECSCCPIKCHINEGRLGACRRYLNDHGRLRRLDQPPPTSENLRRPTVRPEIVDPLQTAIGVGTTYPDCLPAPVITRGTRKGLDVVTVATEVPLSYSSVIVKVDTDIDLGPEGSPITFDGREVGRLETEQYGSKMLHVGGVNRLTSGRAGFAAARAVTTIANHGRVELKIGRETKIEVQIGHPPVIDGRVGQNMRVGCGSATTGIFASLFKEAADEVVVLDSHVTGQFSLHAAGLAVGAKPTGLKLVFPMSTPGRFFGDHGPGWGGTSIVEPQSAIKGMDMSIAWPGLIVLVTETTGQNGAMFEVQADGTLRSIDLTVKAKEVLEAIRDSCEPSLVSAIYVAGAGGSARAGVCRYPIKLTRAVHLSKVAVSVGGVSAYVLPGGGITFMVDAGQIRPGSFSWTPTPATICPLEYTMELADYEEMGGHVEAMRPFEAIQPLDTVTSRD